MVREEETTEGKKDEKVYETYRKPKIEKGCESSMGNIAFYMDRLSNLMKQQRLLEWMKINIKLYINSSKYFLYNK